MKRFSKFVEIEDSLRDTKAVIEEDLKGEENQTINGEIGFSSQLVKDIDLLLAIMNNLKTGALYAAVGTTTSSKLVDYIKRIAEKIEKNQKEIDKQYKKDLKECIDKICDENGIVKFTSIEELEEVLYILQDDTKYEPYKELATDNMIQDLIKILKEMKNDETEYKLYRDSYPIIANGLETVTKKIEKQSSVMKHLGKDFTLSVFQGYLRDKIKSLVTADSALYRAAYHNAYGITATNEAEEKGAFFADARVEVDIVTKFLLKDTGLEDRIIDAFKSQELAHNRLVKNNSYEKLKSVANTLVDLDDEYQKIQAKKVRKDAILMSRRKDLPKISDTDEERREYLEAFIIPENLRDDKWNEKIIESSNLSQSLGTDGIMHLPQDKYEYALGDFADFISDYTTYISFQKQFISLLENFKNPDLNIYLKNRQELEDRINAIDNELQNEITPRIDDLSDNIESIIPKNSGWFSNFTARLSNRGDIKDLEQKKQELELRREKLINERKNKHDVDLVNNSAELLNYFNIQLNSYLGLFQMWNINVDLDFILTYNIEDLKNLYKNNIAELEEAYKQRIKIILDDLAKVTKSNPQNMYKLAQDNGISLEKPSALVPGALKNFISFLNNCSAINGIADPSILKLATDLCQAKVSIDEEDFEAIFRDKIKVMDEFILGELPEEEVKEETPEEVLPVEEPTIEVPSSEIPEVSDELEVPDMPSTPSDTMFGFKVTGIDTIDEEQKEKDMAEHPQVVQAVKDLFTDFDAQIAAEPVKPVEAVKDLFADFDAQIAAEPVKPVEAQVSEEDEDPDYFNDLLAILNGEAPIQPTASYIRPLSLPEQGQRPLFDYDKAMEEGSEAEDLESEEEPVIYKPGEDTKETTLKLKLDLNNPNN